MLHKLHNKHNFVFSGTQMEGEESDSEPFNNCSENEYISSEYESEMNAMKSVQSETGTEELMNKYVNAIFRGKTLSNKEKTMLHKKDQ